MLARTLGLILAVCATTSAVVSQNAPAPSANPPGKPAPLNPAPSSATPRYDLMTLCDALVSRGDYTLIPKRSTLFVSPEHKQYINSEPGKAQFQQWPKFLGSNLSWISTYEVTLEQARGTKPIHPDIMKTIQQRGGVVIAVYRGSPISMATPAAPVTTGVPAPQKSTAR